MKKLIYGLTILFIFLFSNVYAQQYEKNYLGDDFKLYVGQLLKIDTSAISGFDNDFYGDIKNCQAMFDNNILYPSKNYHFISEKDSLKNMIFRVEGIVNNNGSPYINSLCVIEKPIFVLKDTLSKKYVYFIYDCRYESEFPFLVLADKLDGTVLCSKIENIIDDFTGITKINSPVMVRGEISKMILYKEIKNSKINYFLSLHAFGSSVSVYKTGATILFTDNSKLIKQVKIDVDPNDHGYDYTAFVPLTSVEINLISTKKIKAFRLYVYDAYVDSSEADMFMVYVNCVMKAK